MKLSHFCVYFNFLYVGTYKKGFEAQMSEKREATDSRTEKKI